MSDIKFNLNEVYTKQELAELEERIMCIDTLNKTIKQKDEKIKRLNNICKEFIYFEENSAEYKTMEEKLKQKDEIISEALFVLEDANRTMVKISEAIGILKRNKPNKG